MQAPCVMRLSFCVPLMAMLVSAVSLPDNSGDTRFEQGGIYGEYSMQPAYTLDELCDAVNDMYGGGLGDQIRADLGPDGHTRLVEIHAPQCVGAHDRDTIGINTKTRAGRTKTTKEEAADALAHEYEHVKNARATNSVTDPYTQGPCGECTHVVQHGTQIADLEGTCEEMDDRDRDSRCKVVKQHIAAMLQHLHNCPPGCPDSVAAKGYARGRFSWRLPVVTEWVWL